jgi:signal transduction histidine kinase
MTLTDLLNLLNQLFFLLIAGLILIDLLRHRDRTRLDIFLMFASFVPAIANQILRQRFGFDQPAVSIVASAVLLAHPYLSVRLLNHFFRVPLLISRLALAGFLLSVVLLLVFTVPRPALVTLGLIFYFVIVEAYAALGFIDQARQSGGVSRRRLMLVSLAMGAITLILALAGLQIILAPLNLYLSTVVNPILTALAALLYYLGLSPPKWLRRAWQLTELYDYLRRAPGPRSTGFSPETFSYLCQAASHLVGGQIGLVALWDKDEKQLAVQMIIPPDLALPDQLNLTHPDIAYAWRERKNVLTSKSSSDLFSGDPPPALAQALAVYVVSIVSSSEQPWGLLLICLRHHPLFPDDDLDILALLAEQSAIALDYSALLVAERSLIEQLHHNNAQLQATSKELEAFAYSVSHDLRTPLRAIDGFSHALLEENSDQLDASGKSYLERIRAATHRMGHLIDDLLKLSRVTRVELRLEPANLSVLAQQIVDDWREEGRQLPDQLTIMPDLCAAGDSHLLHLVLDNLISNACKFSSERAPSIVEIGSFQGENEETVFYVRDNGVGFDMAYADKLFGPFQRLHGIKEFPGTGVGLATVERIIRRHGGRVWAEAAVDQGATFYFTLPRLAQPIE